MDHAAHAEDVCKFPRWAFGQQVLVAEQHQPVRLDVRLRFSYI